MGLLSPLLNKSKSTALKATTWGWIGTVCTADVVFIWTHCSFRNTSTQWQTTRQPWGALTWSCDRQRPKFSTKTTYSSCCGVSHAAQPTQGCWVHSGSPHAFVFVYLSCLSVLGESVSVLQWAELNTFVLKRAESESWGSHWNEHISVSEGINTCD